LAIGETTPFFVTPLKTIAFDATATKQVAALAEEEGAEMIVIGLPISLAGYEAGETIDLVHNFIAELSKITPLKICTEDERLTTALANRLRRESGIGRRKKFDRDAAAAAILLETFIAKIK
jgi:RNase H-fold protein (predicted Holliday junction resolvase)